MAFFASYLRHLLMLLDLRAEIVASPSQEALGRLSRIDERTLSSDSPPAGRTLDHAHDEARQDRKGRRCDHRRDALEVARLARIRLYYSSNTRRSCARTRRSCVIQALAYGVYSRDAQQYDVRIKAFRLK